MNQKLKRYDSMGKFKDSKSMREMDQGEFVKFSDIEPLIEAYRCLIAIDEILVDLPEIYFTRNSVAHKAIKQVIASVGVEL